MTVTVLFFAEARERAGQSQISLELAEGSRVSDLLAAVLRAHPALAPLASHLAVAVDGRVGTSATPVPADAEVALLPPVSGG